MTKYWSSNVVSGGVSTIAADDVAFISSSPTYLHVDQRPVVRPDLHADVDAAVPVAAEQRPVGAGTDDRAVDPRCP